MGVAKSCILFWAGDYGGGDKHVKDMRFPWIEGSIHSSGQVATLQLALGAYTNANEAGNERLHRLNIDYDLPEADANLDIKARIAFKNSADGKIYRVELPAPVDTMFEIQGEGDRVKQADLTAIVAAISTAYTATFVPLWGKKIQRT